MYSGWLHCCIKSLFHFAGVFFASCFKFSAHSSRQYICEVCIPKFGETTEIHQFPILVCSLGRSTFISLLLCVCRIFVRSLLLSSTYRQCDAWCQVPLGIWHMFRLHWPGSSLSICDCHLLIRSTSIFAEVTLDQLLLTMVAFFVVFTTRHCWHLRFVSPLVYTHWLVVSSSNSCLQPLHFFAVLL